MTVATVCQPLFRPTLVTQDACEQSWQEIVRHFHPRLVAAVRRAIALRGSTLASDLAEDLAQEVWCRLLAHAPTWSFRGTSEGEAMVYLRRVLESVVADADRAARAQKRAVAMTYSLDTVGAARVRAGEGSSPEARLLAAERRCLVMERCRRALGRRASPLALRAARLALIDGLSSREVSRKLGGRLTTTAIDTMICRLRRRLGAAGIELPRRPRAVR